VVTLAADTTAAQQDKRRARSMAATVAAWLKTPSAEGAPPLPESAEAP